MPVTQRNPVLSYMLFSVSLLCCGQCYSECRAFAFFAYKRDGAVLRFHEAFADRQTETLPVRLRGEERLEDFFFSR